MSAMDDEHCDFDDDNDRDDSYRGDESPFQQGSQYSGDENHYPMDEPPYKHEERYPPNTRPMRPMRHPGPPPFRPGPRHMYQPGYRGPRVMPMQMGGNNRGVPYMRTGMPPNRGGPPFDNFGPPPMGVPRGCPPPRFSQQFPPRFQQMPDEQVDEPMEEPPCADMMYAGHNSEVPPPGFPSMPPNMRLSGPPPPFGNNQPNQVDPLGPSGVPPPGPPPNAPAGPPFSGPPSAPPYNGPPGPPFSGPVSGPPYNGPPAQPYNGPPSTPPFNNPPFNGPPAGPPFSGPPFSGSNPPPPFAGPPSDQPPVAPPPQQFPGPPRPSYPAPPAAPSFSAPPAGPPAPPTPALSGPPAGPAFPGPSPCPPISGPPSAPPTTNLTAPGVAPVPVGPPAPAPPAPSVLPPPAAPVPASTAPSSFTFPPQMPMVSDASQFGLPPPGFGGLPAVAHRPLIIQHPIPSVLPGAPTMCTPAIPPMPMMAPPPLPNLSAMPPVMPPFRSHMQFMPPTIPLTPLVTAPTAQPKSGEDIWVENLTAEGKSYYYNMRTRETRWDRPEGVTVVRQGEVEGTVKPSVLSTPVTTTVATPLPISTSSSDKPAEVALWMEYHSQDGKAYYHNAQTGETTWEKPKVLLDWEGQQSGTTPKSSEQTTPLATVKEDPVPVVSEDQSITDSIGDAKINEENGDDKIEKENSSPVTDTKVEVKEPTKVPKDNSRPVSSTAVPGTPWCVVWTGDGRAFFFNPSQRLSVWEKPDELKGRADVDRLLEKQPSPVQATAVAPQEERKGTISVVEESDGSSAAKKPRLEPEEKVNSVVECDGPKGDGTGNGDTEKTNGTPDKIPVGMEAAKEAEERAARERAVQPLEVRVRRFREMLVEMQVSAFSTWEKELRKIVFDPRYLLLTSKERKQTFETYVKERAEEERREKKNKLKERKEKFGELLEEAGLTPKSTFGDFATKYAKDDRFKGIEKARDRETMFQDYLVELKKRDKEDKHKEKEKVRSDFLNLLKEQKLVRHSHWSDVKRKVESDPRYKAIDSSSRREELFREFMRKLDEVPVREDSSSRKERERRERQEASIREREKEVKEALSSSLREREKEREQQMRTEQEDIFRSMLLDLIRDPNLSWKETKKILRKDARWETVGEVLPRSERDEIFKDHISGLTRKSRDYHKLINDADGRDKRYGSVDGISD